jgi:two-component system, NtrC family, sensor kinase
VENTSDTSNQKAKPSLKIHLLLDEKDQFSIRDQLDLPELNLTSYHDASFHIEKIDEHFIISDRYKSSFKTKIVNLKSCLKALVDAHHLPYEISHTNESEIKRINKFLSNNLLKNNIIEHFNNAIFSSDEIVSFLRYFFNIKEFSHFNVVHLFIHEKGQSSALQIEVEKLKQRTYTLTTSDFSAFYLAIKKSKNRSFGQQVLKGFNFNILGTFLAHEFSLRKHNVILILSRNDFLAQTKTEIEYFNFLIAIIPSFLEILLEQMHLFDKINITKTVLDNLVNHRTINQADIFHHERVSLLGELLNTLRHELSNPLFGLQLTTELLLSDCENNEADKIEMFTAILKSIKRSQSIIENFTKLYKGSEEVTKINVLDLIEEVFTLTKSESRNIKKEIKTTNNEIFIHTNPTWLAQIFFNLIINSSQAFKNSLISEPKLFINIVISQNKIFFDVIDNGPGVPLGNVNEIFKPFYTTKSMGTGLGLAIARNLAEKLNGELSYIVEPLGAHFKLELPYENFSY